MPNDQQAKSGDIYCGQERETGKYFAYQIIDIESNDMTFLLLDYFDAKLPGEKEIGNMQTYKGNVHELDVRKLRKPEWLAENLDNPLRHWDGNVFQGAAHWLLPMPI